MYGFVYGAGRQFFTGDYPTTSDQASTQRRGMWLCGAGVGLVLHVRRNVLWWSIGARLQQARNGAALSEPECGGCRRRPPNWRGSAIGIYRFWRDLGYGIGALGMGIVASLTGHIESGFWFVTIAMLVSGLLLLWQGEERAPPQLNPERVRP